MAKKKTPSALTLKQKRCAGQHFGPWLIDTKWFNNAVAAVKSGMQVAPIQPESAVTDDSGFTILGNTAVIPIFGQMTKGPSSFGGVSTVAIRKALRTAATDDRVTSILLHIDSPGGTVAGTAELGDDIAAIDRDTENGKPVFAHIDDLGASAALWIASQTRRITSNRTAIIGSIGTVAIVDDTSGMMDKMGVKVHVISTGEHKGAFAPGSEVTKSQLDELQGEVDAINEHFLQALSSGRGLPMSEVSAIADGRVFIAQIAKGLGLIDSVQSLDTTLQEIQIMDRTQFDKFADENPDAVARYVEQGKKAGNTSAVTEQRQLAASLLTAAGGDHQVALEAFIKGQDITTVAAVAAVKADAATKAAAQQAEIDKLKAAAANAGQGAVGFEDPTDKAVRDDKQAAADADPTGAGERPSEDDPQALAAWEWTSGNKAPELAAVTSEKGYIATRVQMLMGNFTIKHRV